MNIFVPIDDLNGMMFNNRRQSKDKALREYILSKCEGSKLYMNEYSAKQFEGKGIAVSNNFLDVANKDDYCFVENEKLEPYVDKIETIFICKWNRKYPGDMFLDIEVSSDGWKLNNVDEIQGNSHEKITIEEWTKNEK